jgi:hypothetical protein
MIRRPLTLASSIVLALGFLVGPADAAFAGDEGSRDATGQGSLPETSNAIRPKGKLKKKEVKKRVVGKERAKRTVAGPAHKKDKVRPGTQPKDPKHELGAGSKSGPADPNKADDKLRDKHPGSNPGLS